MEKDEDGSVSIYFEKCKENRFDGKKEPSVKKRPEVESYTSDEKLKINVTIVDFGDIRVCDEIDDEIDDEEISEYVETKEMKAKIERINAKRQDSAKMNKEFEKSLKELRKSKEAQKANERRKATEKNLRAFKASQVLQPSLLSDFLGSFKNMFVRSEEHTSELQSHSFISYAVCCLKKKNTQYH